MLHSQQKQEQLLSCRMCQYLQNQYGNWTHRAPPAGHADNCSLRYDEIQPDFSNLLHKTVCIGCLNAGNVSENGFPLTPRVHTCGKQGT